MSDLTTLQKKLKAPVNYQGFAKRIRFLENKGLLKSFVHTQRKNTKYLGLTLSGVKESGIKTRPVEEDTLWHEVVNFHLVQSLLMSEIFIEAWDKERLEEYPVVPDAALAGRLVRGEFSLAVETELNQKSQSRVFDKFTRYLLGNHFDYVLYSTTKPQLYEAYKKMIVKYDEVENKGSEKVSSIIILMVAEDLGLGPIDLADRKVFFNGRERCFGELLNTS